MSHLTTPRHASPRHATPRHATPRRHLASPRLTTPRHASRRRTLAVLSPHSRHTLAVLSPYSRRTLAILSPYSRRTLAVLAPHSRRTLAVPSPYPRRHAAAQASRYCRIPPKRSHAAMPPRRHTARGLTVNSAEATWRRAGIDLRGRTVNHFIDNTAALSVFVNSYSRSTEMARISNMLWLLVAGMRTRPWFEYVPSLTNIADLPSRGKYELLERLGAQRVHDVPLVGSTDWNAPLAMWIERASRATRCIIQTRGPADPGLSAWLPPAQLEPAALQQLVCSQSGNPSRWPNRGRPTGVSRRGPRRTLWATMVLRKLPPS